MKVVERAHVLYPGSVCLHILEYNQRNKNKTVSKQFVSDIEQTDYG